MILDYSDTICALSTANGMGAIAVIRVSGKDTFSIVSSIFSKDISTKKTHTAHFGVIKEGEKIVDEVLVNVFINPQSFTGEDIVEIGCHGSVFIQQKILQLLLKNGARMAKAGEFSMRAFANGKFDLSQAEAIADLITSSNEASHKLAMQQMRGGFSEEINLLREELINFASLIELELDFSEEDVEFADRSQLNELLSRIETKLKSLTDSFSYGNAIKNGIPIAIIGKPNAGKSTLLNSILKEERAIVSSIAGTTRDTIEEKVIINGIEFRFIDTAGLRETEDEIEKIGVKRALEQLEKSTIYIYLFDSNKMNISEVKEDLKELDDSVTRIVVANKTDLISKEKLQEFKNSGIEMLFISAKENDSLELLKQKLVEKIEAETVSQNDIIVTNLRHFEALSQAYESIIQVKNGLENGITGDFLAIDIRQSLHFLGEITGSVSTDELLGNIFGKFCIGK